MDSLTETSVTETPKTELPAPAAPKKEKTTIAMVALAVVLVLCLVAAVYLGVSYANQQKISALLQTDKDKLSEQVAGLQADLKTAEDNIADLNNENTSLSDEIDTLTEENKSLDTELDVTAAKYANLESVVICNDIPVEINFESNDTISESLKVLVTDTFGQEVKESYWDTIWNNSDIAYHDLITEYRLEFITSIENKDTDERNYVFWVDYGCFLKTTE